MIDIKTWLEIQTKKAWRYNALGLFSCWTRGHAQMSNENVKRVLAGLLSNSSSLPISDPGNQMIPASSPSKFRVNKARGDGVDKGFFLHPPDSSAAGLVNSW
jgi:hypothetical protein